MISRRQVLTTATLASLLPLIDSASANDAKPRKRSAATQAGNAATPAGAVKPPRIQPGDTIGPADQNADLDFTRGDHLDIDASGGQSLKHPFGHA